jgi:hypothetical protein
MTHPFGKGFMKVKEDFLVEVLLNWVLERTQGFGKRCC